MRIVDIREGKIDGQIQLRAWPHVPVHSTLRIQSGAVCGKPGQAAAHDALTGADSQLGIDRSTRRGVYEGNIRPTTSVQLLVFYWTLNPRCSELSFLNGVMTAWRAAGLPVSTETSMRAPSNFEVRARSGA